MSDDWDDEDEEYSQYEKDEKFGEAIAGGYHTGKRPVKNKNAKIEQDSCYFCRRTQRDWESLHSQLIGTMKSSGDDISKESNESEREVTESIASFRKIWGKVNKKMKLGAICSDPETFLPEEISQYWDEDWYESTEEVRNWINHGYSDHPIPGYHGEPRDGSENSGWYSLEFLSLRWMIDYYRNNELSGRGHMEWKKRDVRLKTVEKKLLKSIETEFRENFRKSDSDEEWNRDGDFSKDDLIYVKSRLNDSLTKLLTLHGGLTDFVWKPFSDSQITGVSEKDDSWKSGSGGDSNDSRTDLFSVSMKICPICLDRFQSSDY